MDNILMYDVCEVYLKELNGSKEYFYGLTKKGEINQTIKQESIRGGIGNGVVGVIQSDKEVKFKVATVLQNDSLFAIQSGADFATTTITTMAKEESICATNKLPITGTPKGTAVMIVDSKGVVTSGTFATGNVSGTGLIDGKRYTVLYSKESTTAQVLTIDSKKFPKNYYVELHTIAVDVDTNAVIADVYWIFNKALPNGALSGNYEAGTNASNEVEFTAQLLAGSTEYGKYVVVPRA